MMKTPTSDKCNVTPSSFKVRKSFVLKKLYFLNYICVIYRAQLLLPKLAQVLPESYIALIQISLPAIKM